MTYSYHKRADPFDRFRKNSFFRKFRLQMLMHASFQAYLIIFN